MTWLQGGYRGAVPNYTFMRNKPESEFLTDEVEYSQPQEHLGLT